MNKIKEIDNICKKYNVGNYIINKDGGVDVYNTVDFRGWRLVKIPLNFNEIHGNCDFSFNNLTSLKGSPVYVSGRFDCSYNKLTDLKYSPNEVSRSFFCSHNKLNNLEYGPTRVGESYWCDNNLLTSLKGVVSVVHGGFKCNDNRLKDLKYGPYYVYGIYDCSFNYIKNLEACAKLIRCKLSVCCNRDFYSLEGLSCDIDELNCKDTIFYSVWRLFEDESKIELFNDMDIIREDSVGRPVLILNRLNEFLDIIGKPRVEKVVGYINI